MTSPDRPTRFRPPIAGCAAKTGWEALDKWVGGGGGAPSADAAAAAAPSGKTGWEALGKWVGGAAPAGEASAAAAPSGKTGWEALDKWVGGGGEKSGQATDSVQERAGELREDLKEIREKLPTDETEQAGKGLFAAIKRMFGGK
jgi:hypothetical protein